MVIYTNKFIPKRFASVNLFFFILMRPEFKGDKSLMEHELVHTEQVWKWLILQPIMYHASKKWRLKFEAEAYAVSVKYGLPLKDAGRFLSTLYNLDISQKEAEEEIASAYCEKYKTVLLED